MTTPNTSGNEGQHSGGGFTPGPWKAVLQFGEWFVRQDPVNWNGMGYQFIAGLPAARKATHHGEMFAANARLIAAAPELLEALTETRRVLRVTRRGIDELQDRRMALENVDAALGVIDAALSLALGTAPGSVGEGSGTDDSPAQSLTLADAGPNSPRSPDNHSFDGREVP